MITFYKKIVKILPRFLQKRLSKKIKITAISDKKSRRLNRVYRGKNKSANVLSFRYGHDYGEILVCPEVIRREAERQGNTYKYQMTWMVLHGMLHLAGLHHERSKSFEKRTKKIEEAVLNKIFANSK
jgi:probable rRNA maturation factor